MDRKSPVSLQTPGSLTATCELWQGALEKSSGSSHSPLEESGAEDETQAYVYRRVALRRGRRKRKLTPCRRRRSQGRRWSQCGADNRRARRSDAGRSPGPSAEQERPRVQRAPVSLWPPIGWSVLRRPARRAPGSRAPSASRSAPRLPGCGADDLRAAQAPSSRARRPFCLRVPVPFWPDWREELNSLGSLSIQAPGDPGRNRAPVPFDLVLWRFEVDIKL